MGFFRQEYWSGLPFPSPTDLPDPGIKLASPEEHRRGSPETDQQLIFNKVARAIQQQKSSTNDVRTMNSPDEEKGTLIHTLHGLQELT